MSESEVLTQIRMIDETYWALVQWWASVSFGLIALGYFASKRLRSLSLLLVLIALYVLFSGSMFAVNSVRETEMYAFVLDLEVIAAEGRLSQGGAQTVLTYQEWGIGGLTYSLALIGTFAGTIVYLVLTFLKARKE